MKKSLILFFLSLIYSLSIHAVDLTHAFPPPSEYRKQICKITVTGADLNTNNCTGTFVDETTFVTADHCFVEDGASSIVCPDPQREGLPILARVDISAENRIVPSQGFAGIADSIGLKVNARFEDVVGEPAKPLITPIPIMDKTSITSDRSKLECVLVGYGTGTADLLTDAKAINLNPSDQSATKGQLSFTDKILVKTIGTALEWYYGVDYSQYDKARSFTSNYADQVKSGDSGGPIFCKEEGSSQLKLYGVLGGSEGTKVDASPIYVMDLSPSEQQSFENAIDEGINLTTKALIDTPATTLPKPQTGTHSDQNARQ